MKRLCYIAMVVDAEDEIDACDAVSEAMRSISMENESIILDWQHLDVTRPFEPMKGMYEYENWRPERRLR